ncbi:MAG TPA: thiamine pyrophosphate-binding protein [Caulobacteraceae bacterium]|jgi:acetolactate synthase-1/2/3 large subunit|nr:thiamine pyrophosphate-binding protein [Caulobacteraceae bacterium]
MPKMTGSRHIAEALRGYGVSHVFFVPAVLLQALAEMEDMDIARIMTHGEKSAAYMADGYARASGKPGVCMAQNIGGSNLAAGLRDAVMAGSPVIALTGGPTPSSRYRNFYQEVEDFSQFDPVTKFNVRVDDVTRLPDLLRQAFREATSGAPGPAHLQVRGPLGNMAEIEAELTTIVEEQFTRVPAFRALPDPARLAEAAQRLAAAERPIIVAGGGVATSGAQAEVVALAELLGIPVATSLNAKGSIPDNHPLSVGVCGTYSRACANRAVSEADLVFFIGSHTGSQVTTNWTIPAVGAPVIQLDIDPSELGRNYPNTLSLLGDAKLTVQGLLDAIPSGPAPAASPWVERIQGYVREWREQEAPRLHSDAVPMRPERICQAITDALPAGGVVVCDTGHSGIWAGTMIDLNKEGQRFIRCAGSLGWSLPGAMGVKCAKPDSAVIVFAGDGAFYYHIAELETAARYGVNVIVVVNNNSALNQEIGLFDRAYGGKQRGKSEEMWRFREIDFAKVAESFDCVGLRAKTPAELDAALRHALTLNRPVVIDAISDVYAMSRPAWTPGSPVGY